jgi:hypothetical protein
MPPGLPFLLPLAVEVHDHVVFAAEQDPAWWLRVVDYGEYRLGDPWNARKSLDCFLNEDSLN